MLLPTGGPKGFGLSLLIDLICGLLSGGATGRDVQPLYGDFAKPYDCSHIFIAIDVAHFGDVAAFKSAAAAAAGQIRSGQRAPGVNQLFTPGEPEWRNRERAQGQLTLPSAVADMLTRYATKLGVSPHPFAP
jgi:LDH2 family malate/lactate/ureidoglycolate dehydrogenase